MYWQLMLAVLRPSLVLHVTSVSLLSIFFYCAYFAGHATYSACPFKHYQHEIFFNEGRIL